MTNGSMACAGSLVCSATLLQLIRPLKERSLMKEFDWRAFGLPGELAPTPYGVVTTSVQDEADRQAALGSRR